MTSTGPTEMPLGRLARGLGYLASGCALLGGMGIVAIMLIINADVVGRGALSKPFPATAEIVSAAIVAVVFLQLPSAIRAGRAIRSDMFIDRLRSRNRRAADGLDALHHLCGAVMLAILVFYLWPHLEATLTQRQTVGLHGVLLLPRWPFTLPVFVGAVLATLQYMLWTVAYAREALTPEPGNE